MQLATAMSLLEKKALGKLSQLLSLDDIAKLPAVYVTPPAKNVKGNACSGKSLHSLEKATSGERTSTEPSLEATERSLVADRNFALRSVTLAQAQQEGDTYSAHANLA
jgi:hypothetical protein